MEGFMFQNVDRDSGAIRIAKEYVANLAENEEKPYGIFILGTSWDRKKLSGCLYCKCITRTRSYRENDKFQHHIKDLFAAEDKTEYIRLLNGYELLIIDDLGVERNSEYALENIFSVIDWRYQSGKPLIITTNIPLVQLKQETKIEKKRIYDRILERCIPVKIDGVSRREAMANDNMRTMKNILKI